MKNYTLLQYILLLFLSLFLFNCDPVPGNNKPTSTSTPNVDPATTKVLTQVQNPEVKKAIETFVKDKKKLMEFDFLLLVLDETSTQDVQIEIINYFMTQGDKNIPPKAIYAVLFKAIQQKKEALVKSLLHKLDKIDGSIRDNEDRTLLHEAVVNSSADIVDTLILKGGANLVNAGSSMHGTPLHYVLAAPFKLDNKDTNNVETRKKIVGILLQVKGIKLNLKNPTNKTANELAQELATQNSGEKVKEDFYKWAVTKIK